MPHGDPARNFSRNCTLLVYAVPQMRRQRHALHEMQGLLPPNDAMITLVLEKMTFPRHHTTRKDALEEGILWIADHPNEIDLLHGRIAQRDRHRLLFGLREPALAAPARGAVGPGAEGGAGTWPCELEATF